MVGFAGASHKTLNKCLPMGGEDGAVELEVG